MKTNYTKKTFQRAMAFISMTLFTFVGVLTAQTTTTVFIDDFNREATATPLSAGGVPEMSWVSVTTSTGIGSGSKTQAALIPDATDDYALRIYPGNSTDGQTGGRTYAYGALSSYTTSFNSRLANNTGAVTWTFTFRTNRNTALSGFDENQYGIAVVLAADGYNFLTANGYAVILNRHASVSPKNAVSLVKFASGIDLNTKVTTIIGPSLTETTDDLRLWYNVKVVYTPSTDTWELFVRKQASGGYTDKGDPTTVTTLVGSATVDNTYTATSLTHCGFLFNHSAVSSSNVNSNTVYIDDFKVTVFDPTPSTSVSLQNDYKAVVLGEQNKLRIIGAKTMNCRIYTISGQCVSSKLIQNNDETVELERGVYLVRVDNEFFKVFVK